jgi:hypothetical protein
MISRPLAKTKPPPNEFRRLLQRGMKTDLQNKKTRPPFRAASSMFLMIGSADAEPNAAKTPRRK